MFCLRDQTRRQLLLAAFWLLCVLPTVAVLTWGVSRHWPGYAGREAEALSRQFGLDVSLTGLEHLRPGVVRYDGLQLTDPETGKLLLRCRSLEADWKSAANAQGKRTAVLSLNASQSELQADGLRRLWQLLGRILQHDCGMAGADVRLTADNVVLQAEANSETLVGVEGEIDSLPSKAEAKLKFGVAGMEMSEPAFLRVLRNRQVVPPATAFELNTRGSALPCRLLATGIEALRPLGPQSRFRGYIWAHQTCDAAVPDDWEGEVLGQLSDVDLGTLLSERFPHRLSGMAQIEIQSAHFSHGRLDDGTCELQAGPGDISRSLLDAGADKLGLIRGPQASLGGDPLPYERLSLAVVMDGYGLRLWGRCPSGAILVTRQGPLLTSEPIARPRPVVALLQMLVPASDVQVPATRQTDWLMRHLPVPPSMATRDAKTAGPPGDLRSDPSRRP